MAGFGRIETIGADEMFPSADEMSALEESAVAHMNDDHDDAIQRFASKLLGATPGGWKIAGIDPDGADLLRGEEVAAIAFRNAGLFAGQRCASSSPGLGSRPKSSLTHHKMMYDTAE